MEFLKENAKKFLELAEECFERKDYKLVMFFVDQFFQLGLKYLLMRRYGEFPKSHSLKLLFQLTRDDKTMDFYRKNSDILREIELAYVASRYFDVDYSERVASRSLKLAKEFLTVMED